MRIATPNDRPDIAALWQEAFGDSEAAVSAFFDAFPACISYVSEENGTIVSMVHALSQTLSPDIPTAYIYAVATLKAHRRQGLCRRLMAFAEQDLRSKGFACTVLTPGEPELFAFYQNIGYRADFTRNRTAFPGGTPISLPEYARLREAILTVPHMVYDETTLAYAQRVYGLTFWKTKTGIAAAGDSYTAEVLPEDQHGAPYAMVKWLDAPCPIDRPYLGFSLE